MYRGLAAGTVAERKSSTVAKNSFMTVRANLSNTLKGHRRCVVAVTTGIVLDKAIENYTVRVADGTVCAQGVHEKVMVDS